MTTKMQIKRYFVGTQSSCFTLGMMNELLTDKVSRVLRALEGMNSSYSDIETVDARCMPYISTPEV